MGIDGRCLRSLPTPYQLDAAAAQPASAHLAPPSALNDIASPFHRVLVTEPESLATGTPHLSFTSGSVRPARPRSDLLRWTLHGDGPAVVPAEEVLERLAHLAVLGPARERLDRQPDNSLASIAPPASPALPLA